MLTVVYLDSVFLLNALMDYLLVLCTGRLAGIPLQRKRYILAAVLGGIYAVAVFLPNLEFLAAFPIKLAAGALISLTAFGGEEKLLRLTLLLFLIACGMAGCVLALALLAGGRIPMASGVFYTDVNAKVLMVAAAVAYLILTLIFRASARHGLRGELLPVQVCIDNQMLSLTALLDTGNELRDPVTGAPVLIVAQHALDRLLSPAVQRLLNNDKSPVDLLESLCCTAPKLRFHLLPYHAVGLSGGLLLAFRSDWVEVAGERYSGLPIALAPGSLGTGCTALWGGESKERKRRGHSHGHNEKLYRAFERTSRSVGSSAGKMYSLHSGKRYSAAAASERAGSRTSSASGPGGSSERTDRT